MDILALLQPLNSLLTGTTMRRINMVVQAMLAMTGQVMMLGIARWSGAGGSYRTVQWFFHTVIPWVDMLWLFFQAVSVMRQRRIHSGG